jgi:lactoylglutathione lyase
MSGSFYVDDVDAAAWKDVTSCATLVTQPVDHPDWGIRTCHVHDPEGTLIEIEAPL